MLQIFEPRNFPVRITKGLSTQRPDDVSSGGLGQDGTQTEGPPLGDTRLHLPALERSFSPSVSEFMGAEILYLKQRRLERLGYQEGPNEA